MISLKVSPYNISNNVPFARSKEPFKPSEMTDKLFAGSISQDETLRLQADESMKQGFFSRAIELYKQALSYNKDNYDANLNLAKTYKYNNDFKNAIPYFQKAAAQNPKELETLTLLGECYKHNGQYALAQEQFERVLQIDPQYDYARRNLLDTKNLKLAIFNPSQAYRERQQAALNNLNEAIKMAAGFLPKETMKNVRDVKVSFDKTAQMGGRSNIAQYEHNKRKIALMDDYTYADPVLVATYTVHEFIHAADNDPYTSIREEQDAYKKQAQFWLKYAKNINDPEMDYVAELYKNSPETLEQRVAEIYRLRDPGIAQTSYNHPPGNKKAAAHALSSNTPLKAYDIIV